MDCPKCQGHTSPISPVGNCPPAYAVHGCPACGHTFRPGGAPFIESAQELQDVFRGATLAEATLSQILEVNKMNPAMQSWIRAKMVEYGLQMWNDGLKQGLLMNTIRGAYEAAQPKHDR